MGGFFPAVFDVQGELFLMGRRWRQGDHLIWRRDSTQPLVGVVMLPPNFGQLAGAVTDETVIPRELSSEEALIALASMDPPPHGGSPRGSRRWRASKRA